MESHIQHRDASGSIFRGKCFSSHRHTYNTPFKMEDGGRKLMFFLAAETKKRCGSHALFLPLLLSLSHLFCLPQLIHIVTPFNRGQAVKDPITEVKHTFHIFSVDLRVWTTNFMWKCIEIGDEFRRGVEWSGVEGKVERLGREGSVRMEGPESGVSERFKR